MLSPDEIRDLEAEAERLPGRRSAAIDALRIVQRHRGWVSDQAIEEIAAHLGMSPADLDSIATFYNLIYRRPVGRHVVLLCDSVSCWLLEYEALVAWFRERHAIGFGGTSADGRFTLLPVPCLGRCEHAPALLVDGDAYGDVTPERLDDILARYP